MECKYRVVIGGRPVADVAGTLTCDDVAIAIRNERGIVFLAPTYGVDYVVEVKN